MAIDTDKRSWPFWGKFDYLKVQNFDRSILDIDDNYKDTYSLASCVTPSSVKIQYTDNGTSQLTCSAVNDHSEGFAALHEGSIILAGSQMYVIQNYTKKSTGNDTVDITATQIVNAFTERIYQPRKWSYQKTGENIAYVSADDLVDWFIKGVDMQGFDIRLWGYFPHREVKNIGAWNLKQLLTQITTTWPGTVIFGWGQHIYVYGYKKQRDANGNLVNVRDQDTGLRFNSLVDASDVSVGYDMSKMCNAVEVKAALRQISTDTDDENSEVFKNLPYFPSFMAVSQESIKRFGTYYSTQPLTDFTNPKAGADAAREHMVLEPSLKISATIKTPGRRSSWPRPGYKYTLAIPQDNEVHHVKVCGFTWYPFDSSKGLQLELASVDPGIIANLRETIIHDAELSPSVTQFKALSGGESSDGDDGDDDTVDTDGVESRDDDYGDGTNDGTGDKQQANASPASNNFRAYLPISDRGTNAHITRFGNVLINNDKTDGWSVRATTDDMLAKLRDGKFNSKDINLWTNWREMLSTKPAGGGFINKHGNQHLKKAANLYSGHNVLLDTGAIFSTAGTFTFRTGLTDDDFFSDGTVKHYHKDEKGHVFYRDDGKPNKKGQKPYGVQTYTDSSKHNPGSLGDVQAGTFAAYKFSHYSRLSLKKNVKPLNTKHALKTILNTDIGTYQFKDDPTNETQASLVIDDVHEHPQWSTPKELLTKDGKHANDTKTVAYLVAAVQEQQRQIEELKRKLKDKDSQNK